MIKIIKMSFLGLIFLGSHHSLTASVSVLNENFDSYSVGDMPVGWSGTSAVQQANAVKYVAGTSTSTASSADPLGTISFPQMSGEFSIECRLRGYESVRFSNTISLYAGPQLVVKTMNVNNSLRVDTTLAGTLHNFTGGSFTAGIGSDGWFTVRMELNTNTANNNVIVYVDGAVKKILTVPGLRGQSIDRIAFGYLANVDSVKIDQGAGTFNIPAKPDPFIERDHVAPFPGKLSPAGIPATSGSALFEPFLGDTPPEIVTELSEQTTNGVTVREVIFRSLLVGSETNLVYAVIASPEAAGTYPGVMWLHGGGGHAEVDKAVYWAEQGYVAIALDQPGIAEASLCPNSSGPWKYQVYSADRWYADPDGRDSVLFDGVVSELQAFALLRSLPNVDSNKCGITGISWGGYSTTMVSGLLGDKVKAAYSIYGCGFYELTTFQGSINPMPTDQRANWFRDLDAGRRANGITAPFFMAAAVKDTYFYPPAIEATLNEMAGNINLVYAPVKSHSLNGVDGSDQMAKLHFDYHLKGTGGSLPEVSVVSSNAQLDGGQLVTFQIVSDFSAAGGKLYYSAPGPDWPARVWVETDAVLVSSNTYEAVIPSDAVLQDVDWYVMASDNRPATASSMITSVNPATGSIQLVEYAAISADTTTMIQISDGSTPTGNVMAADPASNSNPIWNLWNSDTTALSVGNRYIRFRMDLRSNQNAVSLNAGGSNNNLYNPAAGSNDFQASGSGGGFLNTLQASTLASFANGSGVAENGWIANDGTDLEEINWLMTRPDDSSTASSIQAVALGFLWTDSDASGTINSGDIIALKYGVTSVDFSEIDTVVELDTAVGNMIILPVGLTAQAGNSNVILDWSDSMDPNFASYTVYRSEDSGINYLSVGSGLTQSTFTDSGVVNGTTYYYVVTATDTSAAVSGYSNEASATPAVLGLSGYDSWGSDFGLSGSDAAEGFDYDLDGLVNLGEYAFGGSPIDVANIGVQPWLEGNLKYVFELVDDTNLTYAVITTTDLVNGGGSVPVALESSGDSPTREGFKIYTYTVDTTAHDAGFLALQITN